MKKLWKPALLLAAIAIMAYGVIGSGAWFTDNAASPTSQLSSGTLSIEEGQFAAFNLGTISNMAPGDLTPYISVYIKNDGSISLGWFGDLVINDSMLKDVIYIDYAKMEFLGTDGTTPWYPADEFIKDGVYAYELAAPLAGPDGFVTVAEWDGNNGMGVTPYEFMGYLDPGYMYKLTMRFGFLTSAGDEYQAQGPLDLSFEVTATQVKQGALDAMGLHYAFAWLNLWPNCQAGGTPSTTCP